MTDIDVEQLTSAWSLTDKTVLITGATSGIGQRTARVLAAVGATVAVAGRRRERLEQLTVNDLDHELLLLATPAGSFITGTTITIDGGSTAGTY